MGTRTTQTYIGVTANDFKTRYRNHLKSLRNEKYKHETELSKHVWNLEKENRQFSIRWAIVKQTPAGRNGKQNCALCLEEKLMIMKGRSKNILNRRSEMFTKCLVSRHFKNIIFHFRPVKFDLRKCWNTLASFFLYLLW